MQKIPDDPSVIRPVLESLRKTFRTGKTKDISYRVTQLKNLLRGINELTPQLDEAGKLDLGVSPFINFMSSTSGVVNEINDCIRNVRSWAKPVSVNTPLPLGPARSYIKSEPLGVCLVISAWNYPLVTLIPPVATAIAAGNCVVAKPSEMAPHTSKVICELFDKYLDKECFRVIEGQIEVAKAITREKFDVIVFTGSPEKGKLVAKAAAENLIPCVLELGGKSPTIIDKEANLDNAAMRVIQGRFLNAGQTCIAPDYVFAHKDIKEQFLQKLQEYKVKFYGEDAYQDKNYSRIINTDHTQRLKGYLDENHGGKIVFGGDVKINEKYIGPTVIDSPNVNSKLMKDEIFGPILPVFEFSDLDTVINFINDREKPLALYYFGSNLGSNKTRIINETSSGAIMINDSIFHILNSELPFGGVGSSGYGSCHGKRGFDCVSHEKPIMEKFSINMFPFNSRYPPFASTRQTLLRGLLKTSSISQMDAIMATLVLVFVLVVVFNWGYVATVAGNAGKLFGNSKSEL